MSENALPVPGAENPEKLTGLKQGPIKKVAAGIPAVVSAL